MEITERMEKVAMMFSGHGYEVEISTDEISSTIIAKRANSKITVQEEADNFSNKSMFHSPIVYYVDGLKVMPNSLFKTLKSEYLH